MKDSWHNNKISKKLNEEYPHDFSICDIDGACRVFFKEDGKYKNRLVIYESKEINEEIKQTQLNTLWEINANMRWENFDEYSGVYLIRHDEEIWNLKIYKIQKIIGYQKLIFECEFIKDMTMDGFYNWISATDKRDKELYISNKNNNKDIEQLKLL